MRIIPPSPKQYHYYVWWDGLFTDADISYLIDYCDSFTKQSASVGGANNEKRIDSSYRSSEISWIPHFNWIGDKFEFVVRQLNGQFYNYDILGFVEEFQYTVYHPTNQHYDWHMDMGSNDSSPRKLSFILLLSDPNDYVGGKLQILTNRKEETLEPVKGRIYCFPSFTLHRVTPVQEGIRRSVVSWVTGPAFK